MRKREKAGIIFSLFCFAMIMAGCQSESTAVSLYQQAVKNYQKTAGVEMSLSNVLTITQNNSTVESVLTGTLSMENPGSESAVAAFEGSIDVNLSSGVPMTISLSYYYTDGVLYANKAGSQFRENMTWEDAREQIGPGAIPIVDLTEADFSTLTEEEGENQTVLSFTIDPEKVGEIIGALTQWGRYEAIYGESGPVTLQEAKGTLVIEDGYFVSESMTLSGTMELSDATVTMKETISITFDTYGEISLTLPELTSYQELVP